jgi:VWFA-related protein
MFKFLAMILAVSLFLPGYTQEMETEETVVLRDLRVHVYDADGNPVNGLKADDFQIWENDQKINLSAFEEVDLRQPAESQMEPAASGLESTIPLPASSHAVEDRYVVVILNSAYMTKRDFRRGVDELEDFAKSLLDGRTKVKIVQIDNSMKHLTPFTKSVVDIDIGMRKATYAGDLRKRITLTERNIVDNIERFNSVAETEAARAANGASFSGDGLADNYRRIVNMKIDEKALLKESYYRSFYLNMMLLAQTMKPLSGSKSFFLLTGGNFLDPGGKFSNTKLMADKLGRTLNDANVTIYSHLAKSLNNIADQAMMMGRTSLDSIGGRSIPLSQLKQASTFNEGSGGEPLSGNLDSWNTVFENDLQMTTGPSLAAESTGGLFHQSTSARAIGKTLREFNEKSKQYYRLNYTRFLQDVQKRAEVRIEVEGAKARRWKVVYGNQFEPRIPYSELKGDERALAFEALLLHGETERDDLDIKTGFKFFRGMEEGLRIPVYLELPTQTFPEKGFEFGFVALGADDTLLDITKSEIPQAKDNQDLLIYDVLLTEAMPAELRFYVRNLSSNAMSFKTIALDPESSLPQLGPLSLAPANDLQLVAFNHLREGEEDRKTLDPYLIGNSLFKPSPKRKFPKTSAISYFLHLDDPQERSYRLDATLIKNDQPIAISDHQIQLLKDAVRGSRFYGQFSSEGLEPGNYTLAIRITDQQGTTAWERRQAFEILNP